MTHEEAKCQVTHLVTMHDVSFHTVHLLIKAYKISPHKWGVLFIEVKGWLLYSTYFHFIIVLFVLENF